VCADDSAAPERRLVGSLRTREAARVRGHRTSACVAAAGLHREDGFDATRLLGGSDESLSVRDGLKVGDDHTCRRVRGPVLEQIGLGEVGTVAEGDEVRKADPLTRRPIEDRGAERAGL